MKQRLKIAIQKSGRLSEGSVKLLKSCGIKINVGVNKLKALSSSFPVEILYLRDDDIPQYVSDGVVDVGIIGENVFVEKQKEADLVQRLGFSKCKLSLAIPKTQEYKGVEMFQGKRIATSYPNILKQFLSSKGVEADIHEISGSVEIAPGMGLADAVCDIVSSGSTLFMNNLEEVEIIMRSEAILIANPKLADWKQTLLDKIIFRINAINAAGNNKYILLNAPNDAVEKICNIIPGMKNPTVMPLATKGWSSIHSVVDESAFWDSIDQLKAAGAEGILVIPIEKMIV